MYINVMIPRPATILGLRQDGPTVDPLIRTFNCFRTRSNIWYLWTRLQTFEFRKYDYFFNYRKYW